MADPALLLQEVKFNTLMASATDAAGRTGSWVNLANTAIAYIKVDIQQGNAATVLLSILQAQDNAGTNSKVLANAVPIYVNAATDVSDAMVRQTDAVNFTTDAGVHNKQIIFQVDPSQLDVGNGFGHITVSTGASNVGNITHAEAVLAGQRYAGKTLQSATT